MTIQNLLVVLITHLHYRMKTLSFTPPNFIFFILMLILFLGSAGCAGTSSVTGQGSDSDPSGDSDYEELEELYWSRIESDRMSFTDADVNFMVGMIAHHAQALIMSRLAPENDASSKIQTLAARIINSQQDEIRSMQNWLSLRDQPVPEVHIDGLNLMIHGLNGHHHNHTSMPGMLSDKQLRKLSEAKGSAFDRLFLEYMIDHHNGAVIMVDTLFGADGAAQDEDAFRLAADINADQVTEIERMKLMLEEVSSD